MTDTLSPGQFWGAQGMRAISTCLVTTEGAEGPAGFLALSVAHLTASPPVMTVSASPTTSALAGIRHSGAFALNFLAAGAEPMLARFTGREALEGAARFEGLDLTRLATGAPILPGVIGVMDCKLVREEEAFGSFLLFGEIQATQSFPEARPLVNFAGKVTSF